jgi:hypothetical protein
MLRIDFLKITCTALALALTIPLTASAGSGQPYPFKLTLSAFNGTEEVDENKQADTDTILCYTWTHQGQERILSFDSLQVTVCPSNAPCTRTLTNREKLIHSEGDTTTETLFEDAPDEVKQTLRASFGVPIFKRQVDESGHELAREVVASPHAQDLIDQGMIANALLFHPPFERATNLWTSTAQISMGNGALATGELTYWKSTEDTPEQTVEVWGTLINEHFQLPGQPFAINNAQYIIEGEQTFCPARNEWVSGKWEVFVYCIMTWNDKPVYEVTGTVIIRLESIPDQK